MKTAYDYLLENLIDLNKENRVRWEKHKSMLPVFDYIYDYCMVKLDIGRCVGKTEFIKNHAKKNDIVFVVNSAQAEEINEKTRATVHYGKIKQGDILDWRKRSGYYTLGNNRMEKSRFIYGDGPCNWPTRFENIYVDEPHLIFGDIPLLEELKPLLMDVEQTIFVLGK